MPLSPSLLHFPRNELFTGRESELRSLEQFLLLAQTHRRITVFGLGGCGKSALAIELAYRMLARVLSSRGEYVEAVEPICR